jgi:hypothetical protein
VVLSQPTSPLVSTCDVDLFHAERKGPQREPAADDV